MNAPLIKADTCSTCPYKVREQDELLCKLNPPNTTSIIAMMGGKPQILGKVTQYPTVKADDYCHQHPARKMRATIMSLNEDIPQ